MVAFALNSDPVGFFLNSACVQGVKTREATALAASSWMQLAVDGTSPLHAELLGLEDGFGWALRAETLFSGASALVDR